MANPSFHRACAKTAQAGNGFNSALMRGIILNIIIIAPIISIFLLVASNNVIAGPKSKGEDCANSDECGSNLVCRNNVCSIARSSFRVGSTGACSNHNDCAAGLMCLNGACNKPNVETSQVLARPENQYLDGLRNTCRAFGFKQDSNEFAKCVQQLHTQNVQQQRAEAAAWQESWDERKRQSDAEFNNWLKIRQGVNCTTQAIGGTLQTNCR